MMSYYVKALEYPSIKLRKEIESAHSEGVCPESSLMDLSEPASNKIDTKSSLSHVAAKIRNEKH